jgi:hypothetical protein
MHDKLDMMIALVAGECGEDDVVMLDALDTSEVQLDGALYRRVSRVIGRHRRRPLARRVGRALVRVAAAVLILLVLGVTTVMAVPALREPLMEAIIDWYEGYLTIRYDPSAGQSDADGEEPPVRVPTKIEETRKPTLMPIGTVEDVILEAENMTISDYYLDGELIYSYLQLLLTESNHWVSSEGATVSEVDINGHKGTMVINQYPDGERLITVMWSDGEYIYEFVGYYGGVQEALDICRSVKAVKKGE